MLLERQVEWRNLILSSHGGIPYAKEGTFSHDTKWLSPQRERSAFCSFCAILATENQKRIAGLNDRKAAQGLDCRPNYAGWSMSSKDSGSFVL